MRREKDLQRAGWNGWGQTSVVLLETDDNEHRLQLL